MELNANYFAFILQGGQILELDLQKSEIIIEK